VQKAALLHCDGADDLRRAGQVPADAGDRVVALAHVELVLLPEPAPYRLLQSRLQVAAHVEERWSAWPGVQVLVRAADGEVGAVGVELHRDRAGRVAQVPQ